MRQLIVAVALTSCSAGPTEPPADSIYGCFADDQGRTYCVDPNPMERSPEMRQERAVR